MGPILVTGATGTVGREIVRLLAGRGQAVRAAVPTAERRALAAGPTVEAVEFDFGRQDTYDAALRGVDTLFLLRPPAIADTKTYIDPFIEAARARGVRHIVFLSLLGAERIPVVPHRRIEQSIVASGVAHTFLRPRFFMQNLSTTHRAEIRRGRIDVPAGRGRTSFVDARDIAAVAARVLCERGHEGRAYALTGTEALDYDEVAAILTEVLGRRVVYTHPSALAFARRAVARRLPPGQALVMVGIYTTARLGLAGAVTDDVATVLGRPPTTLRQFVADYKGCWAT